MSSTTLTLNHPSIKAKIQTHSQFKHTLIVEPLIPGFGFTLGNSIRRIMLSSIPGFAVTRIKINDDITHEYQSMPGVVEDVLDITLNLKLLRAKILNTEDKVTLVLHKKGAGNVYASDFDLGKKTAQIINPELLICSLDKDGEIRIEIDLTKGMGYQSIEKINLGDNVNPQNILVDALYNPVTNVAMEVEDIRVGDTTNYNRLVLDFDTDGSITPEAVVNYTFELLIDMFQKIQSSFKSFLDGTDIVDSSPETDPVVTVEEFADMDTASKKKILAILEKNGITTKAGLLEKQNDLESLNGVDEKILLTIKEYLSSLK